LVWKKSNSYTPVRTIAVYYPPDMKLYLDCFPCVLNQTLAICRDLGIDEAQQKEIFSETLSILSHANPENPPVDLVADVNKAIKRITGISDLYHRHKQDSTQAALALYPRAKELVETAADPFEAAVRLSIAGNIIDFGVQNAFDLPSEVERVMHQPFAVNDLALLREDIQNTKTILYIADNAGETVFDRLLIETINKEVLYAVRDEPVLNDAVQEDAIQAGIDHVTRIISSGVDAPGMQLSRASAPFLEIYHSAKVIISKGQGNYEALSDRTENIYFLLQAKCDTVSRLTGAPVGGLIVKSARNNHRK